MNADNWLCWKKGETDIRGKFSKLPVNPNDVRIIINYQDPKNLLSFLEAKNYYNNNHLISGLGFKLNALPINNSYLIGIDIDMQEGRTESDFEGFRKELNGTYSEVSPSGKGIRLFGLSDKIINNWSHNHIEVYSNNRYLTVTGIDARGEIKDITRAIEIFTDTHKPKPKKVKPFKFTQYLTPTPNQIANINDLLNKINADCPGDKYRNIIFSIFSLGWGDLGVQIAKAWSRSALHRWSEDYFYDLVKRYDNNRIGENTNPITLGTLIYYASAASEGRSNAWD
tara:strand:- start:68 stop:916 length:849 start_codon:yes stop_codon:yes gene_type:complete